MFDQARKNTRRNFGFQGPINFAKLTKQKIEQTETMILQQALQCCTKFMNTCQNDPNFGCTNEQVLKVYEILLSPENLIRQKLLQQDRKEMAKAFRKIAILVHPDKNRHPEST